MKKIIYLLLSLSVFFFSACTLKVDPEKLDLNVGEGETITVTGLFGKENTDADLESEDEEIVMTFLDNIVAAFDTGSTGIQVTDDRKEAYIPATVRSSQQTEQQSLDLYEEIYTFFEDNYTLLDFKEKFLNGRWYAKATGNGLKAYIVEIETVNEYTVFFYYELNGRGVTLKVVETQYSSAIFLNGVEMTDEIIDIWDSYEPSYELEQDVSLNNNLNNWYSGSIGVGGFDRFRFTANANSSYTVRWDDSFEGSENYSLDLQVTVSNSSGYTYANLQDSGYDNGVSVSTESLSKEIIIDVFPYFGGDTGTYAIIVEQDASPSLSMSPQSEMKANKQGKEKRSPSKSFEANTFFGKYHRNINQ